MEEAHTNILKSLGLCFSVILLVSLVIFNLTLMLTVTCFVSYLAITLLYTYRKVPSNALEESKSWSRTIVGDTDSKTISIKTNARIPTKIFLQSADSWVKLEPNSLASNNRKLTSLCSLHRHLQVHRKSRFKQLLLIHAG